MKHKPLPKVSFQYEVKEGKIRKVKVPDPIDPVVWTPREKVGRLFQAGQRRARKANEKAWTGVKHVYAYSISKLVLAVVSWFVHPKLSFFFMVAWLKQRLAEPSTYRGIVGLMAALGLSLNPELVQEIITLTVAILGFIEFVRKENEKKTEE